MPQLTDALAVDTPPVVEAPTAPFGSVFAPLMAVSRFDGHAWSAPDLAALDSFALHPGTHALHYGSSCFEGLKAHRQPDGRVVAFRPDMHVARLRQSTVRLCLPVPPAELVTADPPTPSTATSTSPRPHRARCTCARRPRHGRHDRRRGVPERRPPCCTCWPARSATTSPAALALSWWTTTTPRTTPQFGVVKTGANYAMALSPIMDAAGARRRPGAVRPGRSHRGDGGVERRAHRRPTPPHAGAHRFVPPRRHPRLVVATGPPPRLARRRARRHGGRVRGVDPSATAELALTGTAAVVAPVGTLVVDGQAHAVGTAGRAPRTDELRTGLIDIQIGRAASTGDAGFGPPCACPR